MVIAEVEQVDPAICQVRCTHEPVGVVVEEAHRTVKRPEGLAEIGFRKGVEVVFTQETDDVVEQKYAVDGVDGLLLQAQPVHQETGDGAQGLVRVLRFHAQGHEKL